MIRYSTDTRERERERESRNKIQGQQNGDKGGRKQRRVAKDRTRMVTTQSM